jgi:hypothetical protein
VYHPEKKPPPAILVGKNKYGHSVKVIKCVFENKNFNSSYG